MDSQVSGTGKNFTSPLLKPKKRKIFGREKGYKNAKITKRFILTEVMQVLKYLNPKLEINWKLNSLDWDGSETKYSTFLFNLKAETVINESDFDDLLESIFLSDIQKFLGNCLSWIIDSVVDQNIIFS